MLLKLFYTPMCAKCPTQKERVKELVSEVDSAEYEFVDATENMDEANQYSVRSFPTVVLLDDGDAVSQFTGITAKSDLKAELA